jgi:hypothetical protein
VEVSGEYPIGTADGVVVRFVESEAGTLTVLEIECERDADVFGDVRRALHSVGVDVSRMELRPGGPVVVGQLHLSDATGTPLDDERRLLIQDRVLQVVLAQPHKTYPPPAAAQTARG